MLALNVPDLAEKMSLGVSCIREARISPEAPGLRKAVRWVDLCDLPQDDYSKEQQRHACITKMDTSCAHQGRGLGDSSSTTQFSELSDLESVHTESSSGSTDDVSCSGFDLEDFRCTSQPRFTLVYDDSSTA